LHILYFQLQKYSFLQKLQLFAEYKNSQQLTNNFVIHNSQLTIVLCIFVFDIQQSIHNKKYTEMGMGISKGAVALRERIDKAIQDLEITHEEYEAIMALAFEDGVLDKHEKVLLRELQFMVEHKDIKFVKQKN
jgi:hypothetical protein